MFQRSTCTSETLVSYQNTTQYGITIQNTSTWNITALEKSKLAVTCLLRSGQSRNSRGLVSRLLIRVHEWLSFSFHLYSWHQV